MENTTGNPDLACVMKGKSNSTCSRNRLKRSTELFALGSWRLSSATVQASALACSLTTDAIQH